MRFVVAIVAAWSPCHGGGSPSGIVDSGHGPVVVDAAASSGSGCVATVGGSIHATLPCGAGVSLGYDHTLLLVMNNASNGPPEDDQLYVSLQKADPTDQDFAAGTFLPTSFDETVAEVEGMTLDQDWAARSSTSTTQKGGFTLGITSADKLPGPFTGYMAEWAIHGTMHVDCVADDAQTTGDATIDITF